MKMPVISILRWLLTVYMLICAAFCYAEEPVIIVSNDYEPYSSSKNNGSGVILDIVKQAFDEVHLKVEYEFYPWKRCEIYLNRGIAFAAAPYFKTEERLLKYNYSDPLMYVFQRFFYNKEKFPKEFEWKKLEDFQGYIMGGVRGYWYIPAFEKAGLEIELVTSDLQNIAKLILQRIDFTVVTEVTGLRLLREHYPKEMDKIGVLDKPESVEEFYLLISRTYPDSAEITEKFNNGLKMLKEKDSYRKILQYYNIPEHSVVP